jgi:hypothetical protein
MSDLSPHHDDEEIIRSAYAERVMEAFKVFADNLAVGQSEKDCRDRFIRALDMVRRARDLALRAASGADGLEPMAERFIAAEDEATALSAEDQAMIDKALAGTTGSHVLRPLNPGGLRPRR